MNRNPIEINAIMDAQVKSRLTREQCFEILDAPPWGEYEDFREEVQRARLFRAARAVQV